MVDASYFISWNKRSFLTNTNVFSPKDSSIEILSEIMKATELFREKIPVLDLCCGIGAIGISAIINSPNSFEEYYGFDNDIESIIICRDNIQLHKVIGEAYFWEAGENLPQLRNGIAICNPPFLPKSDLLNYPYSKESLVYSDNEGLGVILRCFQSIKGTGHIFILKSFENQVAKIIRKVGSNFTLIQKVELEIEQDYIIAFTTWKQK